MTEQELTRAIIDYLNAEGVLAFRNNTGAVKKGGRFIKYGLGKGSPDIVGIVPVSGRFLALEVKLSGRDGAKVTAEQKAWLDAAQIQGALAAVVRSIEDVRKLLLSSTYV